MSIFNTFAAFRRCLFTEYNSILSQLQVLKRNVFRPRPVESVHSEQHVEIDNSLLEGYHPNITQFLNKRYYENKDSKIHVPVTSFIDGKLLGSVQLNEFVFGTNPRLDILQRVVVWQRAKARAGTACVKDRSEVRGGGRKPWPQKGLGKARQGSIRAPHWRGGGVVHGPKPKSYAYTLPKKVRRMGVRVALSCRLSQGDLFVVDSLDFNISRTGLENIFEKSGWSSVVLVDSEFNAALLDAVESQKKAEMHNSLSLNVYSILNHHKIVLSLDAIAELEERLCEDNRLIWR